MTAAAVGALIAVAVVGACSATSHPTAAPASAGPSSSGSPAASQRASDTASSHGAHVPSARPAAPLRTGERFVSLRIPQPYTPSAPSGGTDEYRCFLIDPHLTGPAFLTGSQFLPQNAAIVHHAIIFRISPAGAPAARALDARTPGEGWTCFGNDGVDNDSAWVGHWAPGADETLLTQKVGYPMPAGSLIVLQVHYNLLATDGRPGESDRSGIRLRLSDGAAGLQPLQTALLPAPVELPCAADETGPLCDRGAAMADVAKRFGPEIGGTEAGLVRMCDRGAPPVPGNTQHCDRVIPRNATVYAAAGHMHLLGRSIKIELDPGTPKARTLLDVPAYNFDDQGIHPLPTPLSIKAGDTLRVTCTHDATLRRQLPALSKLPPRYVVWGDGTSDEMCLGLLVVGPPV
jgi:hypothetical protein